MIDYKNVGADTGGSALSFPAGCGKMLLFEEENHFPAGEDRRTVWPSKK